MCAAHASRNNCDHATQQPRAACHWPRHISLPTSRTSGLHSPPASSAPDRFFGEIAHAGDLRQPVGAAGDAAIGTGAAAACAAVTATAAATAATAAAVGSRSATAAASAAAATAAATVASVATQRARGAYPLPGSAEVTVAPGVPFGPNCVVHGPALEVLVARQPNWLALVSRDMYGNRCDQDGSRRWEARILPLTTSSPITSIVLSFHNSSSALSPRQNLTVDYAHRLQSPRTQSAMFILARCSPPTPPLLRAHTGENGPLGATTRTRDAHWMVADHGGLAQLRPATLRARAVLRGRVLPSHRV